MNQNARIRAFTLIELLVIITCVPVLGFILVPSVFREKRARDYHCFNNLRFIGLAFKTWTPDSTDRFPTHVKVADGGAKERAEAGDVSFVFLVMSNELSTPKLLVCPQDEQKTPATNFATAFSNTNVSYFVGLDASDVYPQALLSGDRTIATNRIPLISGVFLLSSNTPLSWTKMMHGSCGNILLGDGSAQRMDQARIGKAIQYQGVDTNRLAIP